MKSILIFLLILPTILSAAELVGTWKYFQGEGFLIVREDYTFEGSLLPKDFFKSTSGKYYLLEDKSGIIVYSDKGTRFLDIRELTDENLVLIYNSIEGALPIRYTRATKAEEKTAELAMQMYKKAEASVSMQKAIINNLRQVASAGQQYNLENGSVDVSYQKLDGVYFPKIISVNGESYEHLTVTGTDGTLTVTDKDGKEYSYKY